MVYERKCRVDDCEDDATHELVIKQIGNDFEKYRNEICRYHYAKIEIKFE
jgi:hypothetical protein